jgi:2-phospho-L-lactate guanylyltransferase
MNTALREAQRELRQRDGGLPALIVPIDLPLATADAVAAISRVRADVGIVPDRRDEGTNLLYLSEVAFERLPLAFGTDSFRKHCDAADARGLSLAVVRDWRLTFDVDRPDDYASWRKGGAEGP